MLVYQRVNSLLKPPSSSTSHNQVTWCFIPTHFWPGLVWTKGSQHLAHGMPATGLSRSIPYVAGGTAKLVLSCLAYFMRYIYSDVYIYIIIIYIPWWKPSNLQGFRCATKSLSILAGSLKTEPCRSFSVSDPTDGQTRYAKIIFSSFEHEHFFASPPSHCLHNPMWVWQGLDIIPKNWKLHSLKAQSFDPGP